MSKRIEYIDIARGIGILLVVMGHNDFAAVSPFLYKVIYSFHMPLFFFLSGYFINPAVDFWTFLKKRFNSLLKPYFFTIFLIYFVSISFGKMGFQTAIGRTIKALYGAGYYLDWVQLWFLPHLFVVSLYAFLFYRTAGRINNGIIRWLILLFTLFLASLYLLPVLLPVRGTGICSGNGEPVQDPADRSLHRMKKCEQACPTNEAKRADLKAECYLCHRCLDVCPVEGALEYTGVGSITQKTGKEE